MAGLLTYEILAGSLVHLLIVQLLHKLEHLRRVVQEHFKFNHGVHLIFIIDAARALLAIRRIIIFGGASLL